jgi:hypothetical protein
MTRKLLLLPLAVALAMAPAFGQGGATSAITGVVVDQSDAVIPGATITVKHKATGMQYETVSAENGTFIVPALSVGVYTVTVSAQGFKTAVLDDIPVNLTAPSNVRAVLEVGSLNETVVVQGAAEVVQSQSSSIATTMVVNQLTNLPLATRNVNDFLVFLPGVNTTGGARGSTIAGLPQAAINITIDGINTQDNYLKSSDGFFSYISPRLDAIEEVTISMANPGAESSGQGAVQIKYVTRSGNNEFHGSLYEYHRNPSLNSNYWFNNRDRAPVYKPTGLECTAEQLRNEPDKCKAPRDRVLLNQFGGRLGGPVIIPGLFNGRDKFFFFVNYEEFRLPTQRTRTRTIYHPMVEQGIFLYTVGTEVRQVNLLELAAKNGQVSTMDPTVQKLLADIRKSTSGGTVKEHSNPAYQYLYFQNTGMQVRKFPTARFDINLTQKHRLEGSWNFSKYDSSPDFLNNYDPAFPGFPTRGNQLSNRFSTSIALRSTLTPRLVNEARFGFNGGTVLFNPNMSAGLFAGPVANFDGFRFTPYGISTPYVASGLSRRNSPVKTLADTLSWTRGSHGLSFGFEFTNVASWTWSLTLLPSVGLDVNTTYDPARTMFDSVNGPKNFPGASSTQLSYARQIYASLTGRVTSISGSAMLNEKTLKYTYYGELVRRARMREIGIFAQDSWRVRPGLTVNYGLRWELQLPWRPVNEVFTYANVAEVWGPSGIGNIFKPGISTGVTTQFYKMDKGTHAYNIDYKAFAPSFGFAWSPKRSSGRLGRIVGGGGQTVLRGGFSVAYNRNGMSDFNSIFGSNPGSTIDASRSQSLGNLVTNPATDYPVLMRDKSRLGPPPFMTEPIYPILPTISNSENAFDPQIRTPYTLSWSFGVQREITKDTVVEVRYVATRNLQPWYQRDLNERNIVENGFLDEFKLAMANLQANQAAGRGNNFKYYGPGTGTYPLPITLAYFSGLSPADANNPAKYTSTNFSSSTFVDTLARTYPRPYDFASSLESDSGRRANALAAGLPFNFFVVNPSVLNGGAWIYTNGGRDWYDSMVIELRRRMSKGLLVQANYVFAKGLSTSQISWRVPREKVTNSTLPHAFKVNWLWELPFGRNRLLFNSVGGVLDKIIGGWEFHGTGRIQSGNLLNFGNVRLVGMTPDELRKSVGIWHDDAAKLTYYLPKDLIDNTIKAWNVSATTSTGYSTSFGVPTGRYVAPANTQDCMQIVSGQCAPLTLYIRGPKFTRFDLSLVKRIYFTERVNFELRGEFLNAFNNINFYGATCASSSQTCGQVTSAYTDPNQQQDPGGRLIQFVGRINF